MSQSPLWWRTLVLSTIVMCIVFAVRASGQDKKPGGFATVDLIKVQTEFKEKAKVEGDIRAMQARLQRAIDRRRELPLLAEAKHKELDELLDKDVAARSDKEKKRIDELNTEGTGLTAEARKLQQKDQKDLNDADKKKISENEAILVAMQQSLAALQEEGMAKIQQFVNTNTETLLKQMRNAVAKVAEQKGIAIVFNSEVAPYAGADITQAVVSEVNKK